MRNNEIKITFILLIIAIISSFYWLRPSKTPSASWTVKFKTPPTISDENANDNIIDFLTFTTTHSLNNKLLFKVNKAINCLTSHYAEPGKLYFIASKDLYSMTNNSSPVKLLQLDLKADIVSITSSGTNIGQFYCLNETRDLYKINLKNNSYEIISKELITSIPANFIITDVNSGLNPLNLVITANNVTDSIIYSKTLNKKYYFHNRILLSSIPLTKNLVLTLTNTLKLITIDFSNGEVISIHEPNSQDKSIINLSETLIPKLSLYKNSEIKLLIYGLETNSKNLKIFDINWKRQDTGIVLTQKDIIDDVLQLSWQANSKDGYYVITLYTYKSYDPSLQEFILTAGPINRAQLKIPTKVALKELKLPYIEYQNNVNKELSIKDLISKPNIILCAKIYYVKEQGRNLASHNIEIISEEIIKKRGIEFYESN